MLHNSVGWSLGLNTFNYENDKFYEVINTESDTFNLNYLCNIPCHFSIHEPITVTRKSNPVVGT